MMENMTKITEIYLFTNFFVCFTCVHQAKFPRHLLFSPLPLVLPPVRYIVVRNNKLLDKSGVAGAVLQTLL